MQILQRLFKLGQEKQAINSNIANKKDEIAYHDKKKEIIPCNNNQKAHKRPWKYKRIKLNCKDLNEHLAALIRRENLRACFSKTLYIYSVKIHKEDIIRAHNKPVSPSSSSLATTHNGGNKVLPVNDTSKTSSTKGRVRNKLKTDNGEESNRFKSTSKMKELLRWSAAAKSQKGGNPNRVKVLHFKSTEGVKGLLPRGGPELISESPKISFGLISPESCSTVGSDQKGNWITTDDECRLFLHFLKNQSIRPAKCMVMKLLTN